MSDLPKGWTTVTLGDLIEKAPMQRAGAQDLPLLSMTRHEGLVDQATRFGKRVASADLSQYRKVSRGQLVVSFPINEGVLDFQNTYEYGLVSPAYKVWDLTDGSIVDKKYLGRFLRSPKAIHHYTELEYGSTARRRSLPDHLFLALKVPLPPLNEQRRIAAILDRTASLSSLRKRYLKVLQSTAASLTHDLLVETTHYQPLGKFLERIDSGKSPVCEDRPAEREEWAVLKLGAISSGTYAPEENKALREGTVPSPQNEVHPGDLLFSRKNTRDLVGATAFVRKTPARRLLPDLIFRLILKKEADLLPEYVHAALSAPQVHRQLAELAGGSAASMVNISKAKLKTFEIPVPKFTAQREFVDKLNAIDELAEGQHEQLGMNGSLVSSLQSRAFRGEL